jgi:hypothetical protein
MRIAHLILTHSDPDHLKRMIKRLQHKNADFFIHVDLKADITPFLNLENLGQVNFVRPRLNVYWGGYSMVEATLNGIDCILQTNKRFDYINLLSGQDYPLKDTYEIHQFFKKNPGKVFTEFQSIDNEWTEAIPRIKKYFFTDTPFWGSNLLANIISTLLPARKLPKGMVGYGRSQWFTMSTLHANNLVDYLLDYPEIQSFFKNNWGSDEFFFQTMIYNSDYRSDMVNDNLRYIDWSEGKASPKTLTIDDGEKLIQSGKLFARKFNSKVDSKILDFLDEQAEIALRNRPIMEVDD